jgi:hypothetical protein
MGHVHHPQPGGRFLLEHEFITNSFFPIFGSISPIFLDPPGKLFAPIDIPSTPQLFHFKIPTKT